MTQAVAHAEPRWVRHYRPGDPEQEPARTENRRFAESLGRRGRNGVAEVAEMGRMRPVGGWPDEDVWYPASELLGTRGYVVVRATGEVISSVVADVKRERERSAQASARPCDGGLGDVRGR